MKLFTLIPEIKDNKPVFPFFGMYVGRRWKESLNYEGMAIPRRYGYAFSNYDCDIQLYLIYPLNFIVALVRTIYYATRFELPMKFSHYVDRLKKKT